MPIALFLLKKIFFLQNKISAIHSRQETAYYVTTSKLHSPRRAITLTQLDWPIRSIYNCIALLPVLQSESNTFPL